MALILQSIDANALSSRKCYFGGGTAMALRFGEYRESMDVDFLVSDLAGYRDLRHLFSGGVGALPIAREGMAIELERDVRADQYGIRTRVRAGESSIKLEIVLEARIALTDPRNDDRVCGIQTLAKVDLAAEKLLANADRWGDDSVQSRDLIDLAMLPADRELLETACRKAEGAYGGSVRQSLSRAVEALRSRPGRLEACMAALSIDRVSPAQLWQAVDRVARRLLA